MGAVDDRKEEEITISMAEQKAAKLSVVEKLPQIDSAKRDRNMKGKDTKCTKKQRRVKFGDRNDAISFKKSMKQLRTRKVVDTSSAPEKSILLNKGAPVRIKKNRRKRAADFF